MFRRSSGLTKVIVRIADCIAIIISMLAACFLRYARVDSFEDYVLFLAIFMGIFLVYTLFDFFDNGKYNFYKRGFLVEWILVVIINLVSGIITIFILYLHHIANQYSRIVLALFLLFNVVLMYVFHILIKKSLPKLYTRVDSQTNVIIVGTAEYISLTAKKLQEKSDNVRICAYATVDNEEADDNSVGQKVEKESIIEYCLHNSVDEVIANIGDNFKEEWTPILDEISGGGVVIKYQIGKPRITGSTYQGINMIGENAYLVYANNSVSTGELFIKRGMDIALGLIGTIITLPLTIFIGAAIKIESKGPIFFKQKRVGKNGRVFELIKFRSMIQNAEETKKNLSESNQMEGAIFKIDSDPRITHVGKFIRKTSLDEFPQFINVLKGDMSVVGVRPPTLDEYAQYTLNQKNRLSFRPGITGLWQISGRNDIKKFDDIVALDKKYINEWSLYLDLKIILMTIPAMLKGK